MSLWCLISYQVLSKDVFEEYLSFLSYHLEKRYNEINNTFNWKLPITQDHKTFEMNIHYYFTSLDVNSHVRFLQL